MTIQTDQPKRIYWDPEPQHWGDIQSGTFDNGHVEVKGKSVTGGSHMFFVEIHAHNSKVITRSSKGFVKRVDAREAAAWVINSRRIEQFNRGPV